MEEVIRDRETDLHVPSLCDVEVASGLRRLLLHRMCSVQRAGQVIEDYLDLRLVRHGHQRLLGRIVSLRANFSAYDATYVALAEKLGASLLTADQRLRRAVTSTTDLVPLP